jgi:hypothetical protein
MAQDLPPQPRLILQTTRLSKSPDSMDFGAGR